MATSVPRTQSALKDAGDGDATEKIAVVEIGDLDLQRGRGIARRRGNRSDDFLEQRLEVRGANRRACGERRRFSRSCR